MLARRTLTTGLAVALGIALAPTASVAQFDSTSYYVSSPAGGGIWKGDAETGASSPVGLGLLIPHYGWFGNDGNFYVPDRGWNAIMKITPDGNVSVLSAGGHFLKPVTCIPTLDDQAWVVSDMEAGKILRVGYDGSQTVMHDVASTNGLLNWPDGMAYDDEGNLYAANLGNNTIIRIDPSGNATLFADDPDLVNEPGGVAVDGAGNLFVANYGSHTVARFRLDTGAGEIFAGPDSSLMAYPNDLKLSRRGGMLVSGRSGRVTRIDAMGQMQVVFQDVDLGELDGVAVPEDATLCSGRYTTYGEGFPGTGGIVPELRAIFSPCPGQVIGMEMRGFVGGAPALLFFGTQGLEPGELAFKGAPLLVDPAGSLFRLIPLFLPNAGQGAGAGNLTLQFTVPDVPGLAGFEIYHQLFAADAGAVNGISASNGLKEVFGL